MNDFSDAPSLRVPGDDAGPRYAPGYAAEKPEPNPEWEAKADAAHAAIVAEVGDPNPFDTLVMLEKWKSHAEPADSDGRITFSRALLDSAHDALTLALKMARSEHIARKDEFRRGAQEARHMLANFVEQGGDPVTANSLRLNWSPAWGHDPGQPNPCGELQGGYLGPLLSRKVVAAITRTEEWGISPRVAGGDEPQDGRKDGSSPQNNEPSNG